jgi:uncharacterized membrane protein YhaH (DUF805 family)
MKIFRNYISTLKNSPLTFKGEIKRLDYFIYLFFTPFFIFLIGACEVSLKALLMDINFFSALNVISNNPVKIVYSSNYLFLVFSWSLIPMGTKRIRNSGYNGWFILIPLFNLYLIFKREKL